MARHEIHVKVDGKGIIRYLSAIHPIGDEYFLIEQRVLEDGTIEYYTNEVKEHAEGHIEDGIVKIDGIERL